MEVYYNIIENQLEESCTISQRVYFVSVKLHLFTLSLSFHVQRSNVYYRKEKVGTKVYFCSYYYLGVNVDAANPEVRNWTDLRIEQLAGQVPNERIEKTLLMLSILQKKYPNEKIRADELTIRQMDWQTFDQIIENDLNANRKRADVTTTLKQAAGIMNCPSIYLITREGEDTSSRLFCCDWEHLSSMVLLNYKVGCLTDTDDETVHSKDTSSSSSPDRFYWHNPGDDTKLLTAEELKQEELLRIQANKKQVLNLMDKQAADMKKLLHQQTKDVQRLQAKQREKMRRLLAKQ